MEEKRVSPEANVDRKKVGRPRGPNKTRIALAKTLCERLGVDPLESLLMMVKNRRLPIQVRLDAAKAACPHVYPKLSAIAVDVRKDENSAQVQAAIVKLMESEDTLRLAQALSLGMSKELREQKTPAGLLAPPHPADLRDKQTMEALDVDYEDVPDPSRNA